VTHRDTDETISAGFLEVERLLRREWLSWNCLERYDSGFLFQTVQRDGKGSLGRDL
jgi:hypothetical protein